MVPHGCGTLFCGLLNQDVCAVFVMNKNSTRLNRTFVCSLHKLIKTPHCNVTASEGVQEVGKV